MTMSLLRRRHRKTVSLRPRLAEALPSHVVAGRQGRNRVHLDVFATKRLTRFVRIRAQSTLGDCAGKPAVAGAQGCVSSPEALPAGLLRAGWQCGKLAADSAQQGGPDAGRPCGGVDETPPEGSRQHSLRRQQHSWDANNGAWRTHQAWR